MRVCADGIDVYAVDGPEVEQVDSAATTDAFHCTVSVDEPVNPLWFALYCGYDGSGASPQLRRQR